MEYLIIIGIWFILSLVIANYAKDKKIGYTATIIICLLLSPIIGFIIAMVSPDKSDSAPEPEISIADEIKKLNDLKQVGALTDEEFAAQKNKLLNR